VADFTLPSLKRTPIPLPPIKLPGYKNGERAYWHFPFFPLSLLLSLQAQTGQKATIENTYTPLTNEKGVRKPIPKPSPFPPGKGIRGRIYADDGQPLEDAAALIKGTTIGMYTNQDGEFWFEYDFKPGDALIFIYVGKERQTYVIPDTIPAFLSITLEPDNTIYGEVSVELVHRPRPSFWGRIRYFFRKR